MIEKISELEEQLKTEKANVKILEEEKKAIILDTQQRLTEFTEEKFALQRKLAEKLNSVIPEMPESPPKGVIGTFAGWFSGNDD